MIVISPNFGFRNFDGFGLFFGYQSVHICMGFVDLLWILLFFGIFMVFDWILNGRFKPLKKIKNLIVVFFFFFNSLL